MQQEPNVTGQCALSLSDLRLEARLGCAASERSRPQAVRFDITIRFEQPPAGALSDRLDGTICYAEVAELLRSLCREREFHLIENLGFEAYLRLGRLVGSERYRLKVTKLKPPVPGLEGGASFELGEL